MVWSIPALRGSLRKEPLIGIRLESEEAVVGPDSPNLYRV